MILLWDIKNRKEVKYHLITSEMSIKNLLKSFYELNIEDLEQAKDEIQNMIDSINMEKTESEE